MDTTNLLNSIYKQELADAMEQKVLFRTQLEVERTLSKNKDKTIQKLQEEITELRDEISRLNNKDGEVEVVECTEN